MPHVEPSPFSKATAPVHDPAVIDLRGQEGNFESDSSGCPPGVRKMGFWRYDLPAAGDLLIKPNQGQGTISLWEISLVHLNRTFRGSDGNCFWHTVAKEIVINGGAIPEPYVSILQRSGLR